MKKYTDEENLFRKKNKSIFSKAVETLTDLTIEVARISNVGLTEEQMLFLRSRQFRKLVMQEHIHMLQTFLFGDEKENEESQQCEKETESKNTNTAKGSDKKSKSKKGL